MKEYKIRIYRDNFNRDRWQTFTISYKESDLCIGIDTASYVPEMNLFAGQILRELRLEMDAYITNDPTYAVILSPYFPAAGAPGYWYGWRKPQQRRASAPWPPLQER